MINREDFAYTHFILKLGYDVELRVERDKAIKIMNIWNSKPDNHKIFVNGIMTKLKSINYIMPDTKNIRKTYKLKGDELIRLDGMHKMKLKGSKYENLFDEADIKMIQMTTI